MTADRNPAVVFLGHVEGAGVWGPYNSLIFSPDLKIFLIELLLDEIVLADQNGIVHRIYPPPHHLITEYKTALK